MHIRRNTPTKPNEHEGNERHYSLIDWIVLRNYRSTKGEVGKWSTDTGHRNMEMMFAMLRPPKLRLLLYVEIMASWILCDLVLTLPLSDRQRSDKSLTCWLTQRKMNLIPRLCRMWDIFSGKVCWLMDTCQQQKLISETGSHTALSRALRPLLVWSLNYYGTGSKVDDARLHVGFRDWFIIFPPLPFGLVMNTSKEWMDAGRTWWINTNIVVSCEEKKKVMY